MGWSEVAARSHARRLEDAGWLARYPMTRGDGSLFVATRVGVRVLGLPLRPAVAPAPTWWAHHCACAWTGAYLDLRGRRYLGDRELIEIPSWSAQISWADGKGLHDAGHRPDLVGWIAGGAAMPIEVELTQKSVARLTAILRMYRGAYSQGKIAGLIYVCGDQAGADRVRKISSAVTGDVDWDRISIRLLDDVRSQVIEAGEHRRAERPVGGGPSVLVQSETAR